MIAYTGAKNMIVSASSNGTILHSKIDRIIGSSLSSLNISLNASDNQEYERIHQASKNSFHTVKNNIALLVKKREQSTHRLNLTMSYICTKKNYTQIPTMINLAEELGVDELKLLNLISYDLPDYSESQSLYRDDAEVNNFIQNMKKRSSTLKVTMPGLLERRVCRRRCRQPFKTLPIYGNGDVSICCQIFPKKAFGNVFHHTNVWNGRHMRKLRKTLTDDSEQLLEICKRCPQMHQPYRVL